MSLIELAKRIGRYYQQPGNEAGGNCHIVLDDFNVKDQHVWWCIGWCDAKGDAEGAAILRELLTLPVRERAVLLMGPERAKEDGYL